MKSVHNRLAGLLSCLLFATSMVAHAQLPANYQETWRQAPLQRGGPGIFPIDLDGDGQVEFITALGNIGSWGIADFEVGSQQYNLVHQDLVNSAGAHSLFGMKLIEYQNTKHLWLGFNSGIVEVYDVLARELIFVGSYGGADVMTFALADGNNDGTMDVVIHTQDRVALVDPITFTTRSGLGNVSTSGQATRMGVGNVAGDARNEIVLSHGRVLRIDGTTVTALHTNLFFGGELELGNVDDDAYLEMILQVFNAGTAAMDLWDLDGTPAVAWTHQGISQIRYIHLVNLFGDAKAELAYTDAISTKVVDTSTRAQLWSIGFSLLSGGDYAVFDSDGDGQREILFYGGRFYVHDFATQTAEYESSDMWPGYTALDVGNVDDDPALEFVVLSQASFSGGDSSILSVYDARSHALEWRTERQFLEVEGAFSPHVLTARVANIDGDARAEIIVAGYDNNGDHVWEIDAGTRTVGRHWHFDPGSYPTNIDVADLDADGDADIALTNVDGGTNWPGHRVYVIDTGTDTRWVSALPGSSTSSRVNVADVGAAGIDLVAVNGFVRKVRWSDRQLTTSAGSIYSAALAKNVRGSVDLEILAARRDGGIDVLDGDTLAVVDSYTVPNCTLFEIYALVDLGGNRIAMTCSQTLVAYNVSARQVESSPSTDITIPGSHGSLRRLVLEGRDHLIAGGSHVVQLSDLNANNPPTVPAGSFSVHWRGSADYPIGATDPENDALSYSLLSQPNLGVASLPGTTPGTLHYVPNQQALGSDSVAISVSDGTSSVSRTIGVTVTNTAPVATTAALAFHWRGTQAAVLATGDADSDPTTAWLLTLPMHGTLAFTNADTGAITYTPTGAFVGSDSFSYEARDGVQTSAARTVQVTLTNDAPAATTAALTLHWRGVQNLHLDMADPNGDPLLARISAQPGHATIALTNAAAGDGTIAPSGAFVGADSFTYDAFDGLAGSSARVVAITFTNTAPTAPANITRDVTVGTSVTATLAATDVDSDPLTYLIVSPPSRGTLTLNDITGQLEYQPAAGTGDVTATVAASDGVSQSGNATLTFRYPAASSSSSSSSSGGGKKKGGGSLDFATLLTALGALVMALRHRRAPR